MRHALVLLAAIGLACGSSSDDRGDLEIEWRSPDRQGGIVLAAEATLCRETGLVEVLGVKGDTGLGLVLFPVDSSRVAPGRYPVFHAGQVVEEPRPGANVALRWFDRINLEAHEGVGGEVVIESGDAMLSGSLEVETEGLERTDSIRVSGRFRRVPLRDLGDGCAVTSRRHRTDSAAAPAPTT